MAYKESKLFRTCHDFKEPIRATSQIVICLQPVKSGAGRARDELDVACIRTQPASVGLQDPDVIREQPYAYLQFIDPKT